MQKNKFIGRQQYRFLQSLNFVPMTDQFQQKAQKLMSKLSNLQPASSPLLYKKSELSLPPKNISPTSSSLNQLHKFQEEIQTADDDNKRKFNVLHDEISELQNYLIEENEARNKISENFAVTAAKVEKNMKSALQNISRSFEQKQRKMEQKIEQILTSERKDLQSQLTENQSLILQISTLSKQLSSLQQELQQMKRSRYQLQERIYKQFIDQIKELRKIYERDLKEREERENQLIQCLKGVYTSLMEQVRREQLEREQNQKGFLAVVEQVINRIVDY